MSHPRSPILSDRTLAGDLALAAVCLLLFGVVLWRAFAPAEAARDEAEPPIGHVEERRNDVRRRAEGRLVWEALPASAPVHAEDAVYAAADSQAVLRLDDGARIELDESSLLVVRRPSAPQDGERPALVLELLRGGARGIGGEGLHVKAGEARVSLARGGEAHIRRSEAGASVEVARGEAVLASGQGQRVTVRGGQRGEAGGQGASVTALALRLVAPADGARVAFGASLPALGFSWAPPSEGTACAFELSAAADFRQPLVRREVLGGQHSQPPLAPGVYHWRVRCADQVSEERTFAVRALSAPHTVSPREGALVDLSEGQPLALSWSELPDEKGYRVELALEGDFDKPTAAFDSTRPSLRLPFSHPEGRYCFRIRGSSVGEAPWSAPTCFRAVTRPILKAPRVFEPQREPVPSPSPPAPGKGAWLLDLLISSAHAAEPAPKSALVLRWERIPGAVAYLLEVAEDRGFRAVVVRERTAETFYRWNTIARRDYYWRVRAIDRDGREGVLSEVVKIGSEVAPPVLEAPAAGARLEVAPGGAVRLRWQGTAVLARYRVELAADAAFTQEVAVLEASEPKLSLPSPRHGTTWWRVTGIDLQGQSTAPSEVRAFTVAPTAPEPSGPERVVATAAQQAVQVSWAPRGVAKYQVELVREGATPLFVTTAAPSASLEVTRAGRYAWRVRGLAPDTSWSARRRLEVALAAPALREPAHGAELPSTVAPALTWDAVPLAEAYEVELSAEGEVPTTHRVQAPRFEPGALGLGAYAWRVRALTADAQVSESSASFAFRVRALPPPVPVPEPAPTAEAPPAPHAFQLAALAGMTTHLGDRFTPSLSLELGWRSPPFHGRWGAALRVSGYTGSQDFGGTGPLRVQSRLWAVPVEALAVHVLSLSRVDVVLGMGPLVRLVSGSVELDDGTRLRASSLELGGSVRAGAEYRVGPGKAYTEAGLALSTPSRGLFVTSPVALAFGAGYRVEVW